MAASIAKYAHATRRERRREAVHVVEQVERVGDPDEPDERDHRRDDVVRDQLDAQAAARPRSRRPPNWAASFARRAEVAEVVEKPGGEEESAAGQDPGQLPPRLDGPDRDGEHDSRRGGREDADAAEGRGRAVVPALSRRDGDETVPERRPQQRPEDEAATGRAASVTAAVMPVG